MKNQNGTIADMTAGEDERRAALEAVMEAVRTPDLLEPLDEAGVLVLAVVLAGARVLSSKGPGGVPRGRLVNALCDDLRSKLQRHLPRA